VEATDGISIRDLSQGDKLEDQPQAAQDIYAARQKLVDEMAEVGNKMEEIESDNSKKPKFASYQLPGGENYREVVLAMPDKVVPDKIIVKETPSGRWAIASEDQEGWATSFATKEEAQKQADAMNANGGMTKTIASPSYTSSHFPDVPNYVAHMRLNDRTDAEGRPGTFIEEIQSDRHQAGREKGYRDGPITALPEGYRTEQFPSGSWVVREPDDTFLGVHDTEEKAIQHTLRDLNTRKDQSTVADAPFRSSWPLQMFKRALADAVAAGKQWIGWTTGETQAERYDLSKQVDRVEATANNRGTVKGQYTLNVYGLNGEKLLTDTMPIERVAETVGKDLAEKISQQEPGTEQTYQGQDLKVGGEGMKGFYDTILPKETGKYMKQ